MFSFKEHVTDYQRQPWESHCYCKHPRNQLLWVSYFCISIETFCHVFQKSLLVTPNKLQISLVDTISSCISIIEIPFRYKTIIKLIHYSPVLCLTRDTTVYRPCLSAKCYILEDRSMGISMSLKSSLSVPYLQQKNFNYSSHDFHKCPVRYFK